MRARCEREPGLLVALAHRRVWKEHSVNFVKTAFSEVRSDALRRMLTAGCSDTDPPALGCTFSHSAGSLLQTVHMRIMLCEACPLKPAVCVRRERLFTHRRSTPAVRFAGRRSAARISRCRSADARSSLTCPSELFSTHLCEDQTFRARCLSSLSLEARERPRSHSRAPSPPRRTSQNGTR